MTNYRISILKSKMPFMIKIYLIRLVCLFNHVSSLKYFNIVCEFLCSLYIQKIYH